SNARRRISSPRFRDAGCCRALRAKPRQAPLRLRSGAVARGRAAAAALRGVERLQGEALERAEAPAGASRAAEGRLPLGPGRPRQELPHGRVLPLRATRAQAPRALPSL